MDLAGKFERMVETSLDGEKQARLERVEAPFRAHAPTVLAYAMRRGVQPADAEDIVAETFVVCVRRICEIPEDTLPWLLGVARRVLANYLRAETRQRALQRRLLEAAGGVQRSRVSDSRLGAGRALTVYRDLRPRERRILQLVVLRDLSYEQAGQIVGCSPEAVRCRLRRLRPKLLARLLQQQ